MPAAAAQSEGRRWAAVLSGLNRALTLVEGAAARASAVAVLAMMVIVVVDVLGRYLFNRPLTWSYDFVSIYLMPLIIYLALSNTFRRNTHISVDLLYANFSETLKRVSRLLSAVVVVGTVIPIAWLAWLQAVERYEQKSMLAGSILWPTWIPSAFLALGTALLVVRAILDAVALISALLARSQDLPGESPERSVDHLPEEAAT